MKASQERGDVNTWSKTEALERLGNDEALLQELCRIFIKESPKLLDRLRQAVNNADAEGVERASHSLKGELSYLGAAVLARSARQLEDMGHYRNLSGSVQALRQFEQSFDAFYRTIQQAAMMGDGVRAAHPL